MPHFNLNNVSSHMRLKTDVIGLKSNLNEGEMIKIDGIIYKIAKISMFGIYLFTSLGKFYLSKENIKYNKYYAFKNYFNKFGKMTENKYFPKNQALLIEYEKI